MWSPLQRAWTLIVITFGFLVFIIGIAMFVLPIPGPGSLIAIIGLVILAGHFVWARWLLRRVKKGVKAGQRFVGKSIRSVKKSW